MWSPASATLASIVTILVRFEAILERFSVRINFKSQFQSNDLPQACKCIKIASKLTCIETILTNIAFAVLHIFQVLPQYLWVLPQYLRVLSLYLRVLSRWIHPYYPLQLILAFPTKRSEIHSFRNKIFRLLTYWKLLKSIGSVFHKSGLRKLHSRNGQSLVPSKVWHHLIGTVIKILRHLCWGLFWHLFLRKKV